jgi:hypothetical protein
MLTLVERCIHQIQPPEVHVLFNEGWNGCNDCTYDSVNNKKCPGYSPTSYYIPDNTLDLNSSVSSMPSKIEDIRA